MRTLKLGHTGIDVSALSLGCMYFGSSTPEPTAFRLLDQYCDAGGSFLDTANNYAFWVPGFAGHESERLLGRWLTERGNAGRSAWRARRSSNSANKACASSKPM
jgi:aryl-alcohol dehydrogenase-like predicted oxidoreductase